MQNNKTNFWIGIGFVIIASLLLLYCIKDRVLSCSKITSKCSIETKNFIGQKESFLEYDIKTIKKAEIVTYKNRKYRSSKSAPHRGNYTAVTVGETTIRNGRSNYDYNYSYKPVLITVDGKKIEFANGVGFTRTHEISKSELMAAAQNSDYGNMVNNFNSFLESPEQQNYVYQANNDTAKIVLYVFIVVGVVLTVI